MKVGLQSWGTEGDLRPFLGLGKALRDRGHEVELVFTGIEGRDVSRIVRESGVPTQLVDDGYFVRKKDELAALAKESLKLGGPRKQFELILRDLMDPVETSMLAAARELAKKSDVVAGHFLAHPAPAAAAEAKKPFVMVALQPVFSSRHYPPASLPSLGVFNSVTWLLANDVMKRALVPRVNRTRAACGLPPVSRFTPATLGDPRAILVAVSPSLFPRPPDWDDEIEVCGFLGGVDAPVSPLRLDAAAAPWDPEPALATFLAEPPVFLSFGSMFGLDEDQTRESVECFVEALRIARARGVIQAPAKTMAAATKADHVFYLERAPHVSLFPRCSAIVHHGGAGTTMSAVLAERGSVVVPHAADQFYWGDLLHQRGIASKPLSRKDLAPKPLAARIRTVLDDPGIVPKAKAAASALRSENGPARAAEILERIARERWVGGGNARRS